ncbi:MAG: hypothetical protein K2W78_04975 [Xanthobacteraceae bacterium]|nr:hypothetical protein [Xanthobacteraceae bacterium]
MVLGLSLPTFTAVHVLISLVGIVSGFIALVGLLRSTITRGWTALFLLTTILTSATGFLFPFTKLLPSHIVGIISLVLLAIAVVALYAQHLRGIWRPAYVITALLSLYLNVFVLVVQLFQKVAPLKAAAPTQSEPPFIAAQGVTLLFFVAVIIFCTLRFRPTPIRIA